MPSIFQAAGEGFEPPVPVKIQRISSAPRSSAPASRQKIKQAEEVGLEPTNRFLHGYSLANCWLTFRRTPPEYFLYYHISLRKQQTAYSRLSIQGSFA